MSTNGTLAAGLVLLLGAWTVLSAWVLVGHRRFDVRTRRRLLDEAAPASLARLGTRRLSAVAAHGAPAPASLAAQILVERAGVRLLDTAASPRLRAGARGEALRTLAQAGHPRAFPLLREALAERDAALTACVVSIAAGFDSVEADRLLLEALRDGVHTRSRTATELEPRARRLVPELLSLADDDDAALRFWALTLLARVDHAGPAVAAAAVRRSDDAEPSVRAAAVEALSSSIYPLASPALRRLLRDEVFFVRAHAARALATCAPDSCAGDLVPLLADRNWWVRAAAKESLAALGERALRPAVDALWHEDAFARDGAAEIVLNSGLVGPLVAAARAGDRRAAAALDVLATRNAAALQAASAETDAGAHRTAVSG